MKAINEAIGRENAAPVPRKSSRILGWCLAIPFVTVSALSQAQEVIPSVLVESVKVLQSSNDELRDEVVRLKDALASLGTKQSSDTLASNNSLAEKNRLLRNILTDQQNQIIDLRNRLVRMERNDYFFGGMYQVVDPPVGGQHHRLNPVTGALTCPDGYASHNIGRFRASEGLDRGVHQYVCIKNK